MKTSRWANILLCALAICAGCKSNAGGVESCPEVSSVKTIPLKKGSGFDAAYVQLLTDDACESKLIGSLADVRKMKDPRQAPPDQRFVVGDAALFILLRRKNHGIEEVVPPEVAKLLKSQGVYAYFDYVASSEGRRLVVAQVKQLIEK